MDVIKREYDFPKEITEVGDAIKSILEATALALKDGWQPGQDLPAILSAAFTGMVVAVGGIQNIPEEFKGQPLMASLGALIPIAQGIDSLIQSKKS